MRSRQNTLLLLLMVSALASLLTWTLRTERAELLLARRPSTRRAVEQTLAASPDCAALPSLSARQLLALLVQDGEDPGCPNDLRIPRLLAQHEDERFAKWLDTLLQERTGPERLRVRVCLALVQRSRGIPELVREELLSGRLGPRGRQRVLSAISEQLGPLNLEDTIAAGGVPRFDAGAALVAERFALGDWAAASALAANLRRELERPSFITTPEDPGLSYRADRLAAAALSGLGLSAQLLESERARSRAGFPTQRVPDTLLRWFDERGDLCAPPVSATCMQSLIDWLEGPSPLVDEPQPIRQAYEPAPPLPEPWATRLAALSEDPELLAEAAVWVQAGGADAAERALGVSANPAHAYGWGPWMAGQRGDPADALRYAAATPGASAVAARALADAAGAPLRASRWGEDLLLLETPQTRVTLGDCGDGQALPQGFRPEQSTPLSDETLIDLARMEQISARMALGQVDEALALDALLVNPWVWGRYEALRASLLACQGVLRPGLSADDAAYAAAWAQACGQEATLNAIAASAQRRPEELLDQVQRAESRQAQPPWTCGDPWRVPPPHGLSLLAGPAPSPEPATAPAEP